MHISFVEICKHTIIFNENYFELFYIFGISSQFSIFKHKHTHAHMKVHPRTHHTLSRSTSLSLCARLLAILRATSCGIDAGVPRPRPRPLPTPSSNPIPLSLWERPRVSNWPSMGSSWTSDCTPMDRWPSRSLVALRIKISDLVLGLVEVPKLVGDLSALLAF